MKKFKVTVNGTEYEVEIEEVAGTSRAPTVVKKPSAGQPVTQTPVAVPAPPPKPAPAATPQPSDSGQAGENGTVITAPMPGTVLSINVNEGDAVSKGQVLLILEAMKMENEIMAMSDGVVASIKVAKGAVVSAGDPMIVLNL